MIFVTVGTTMPFDELIETIDRLKGDGLVDEPVICQIGNGKYEPAHCEFFRFQPSVDDLMQQASLVIGHGGTGTVLGLLQARRNFIAVANPLANDAHQERFLQKLAQQTELAWTKDLSRLGEMIQNARQSKAARLALPSLLGHLRAFIDAH